MKRLEPAIALTLLLFAAAAFAQPASKAAPSSNYPASPIRIVVPFSAGGSADIFARVIAHSATFRCAISFL